MSAPALTPRSERAGNECRAPMRLYRATVRHGRHAYDLRHATHPSLLLLLPAPITSPSALVAWFDIEFSHCHKPVRFSTGPASKYTHWKQTVFYLDDALPAEVGDVIEGVVKCRPNAGNKRDLDIEVSYAFQGKLMNVSRTQPYRLR